MHTITLFLLGIASMTQTPAPPSLRRVDMPASGGTNAFYVGNRAPLKPSPFRKLPIGAIRPEGWVRKQLQLEADGFIGHLTEISPWLKKENNAWLSADGEGVNGWEEVPYWLKGFGDLGYVLGDARIKKEAQIWIEGTLGSQREDGWFGPRANLLASDGKPDMWPNMVMINALQTYHEHTGDPRVIAFMTKYFRYQLALPEDSMYLSYWEKHRGGDNIASVYWLYNRTGEAWLLDLVKKIHKRTANWVGGVADRHGVNFAQAFREPAEFWALSHDEKDLAATERDLSLFRGEYGQVPGGLYGADENARPGFDDPRQAAETCAMVEMMLSHETLLTLTGDAQWAERCEDVAFNSLPSSMTADQKTLHYLTSPNMIQADAKSKSPGLQNGGPMLVFDPYDHRCCQHNVSHGWPYYAEHLWLATDGNGLGAALYAPCSVTAKVGDGQDVTIHEETRYPFEEAVTFRVETKQPASFPLTLRIPSWCHEPSLTLNGEKLSLRGTGGYAVLDREWKDGDTLVLALLMSIRLTKWSKNHDSLSVNRGPLTYSLKIGEKLVRHGGTDAWPAFEMFADTPWNYGLSPDPKFEVIHKPWPQDDQPFGNPPIELQTSARRIPQWHIDHLGLVGLLQLSPARTQEPVETVSLIPMGAARLRIASFPTAVPEGGHEWVSPPAPKPGLPASASHVNAEDTLEALSDGIMPKSSGDLSIPRFTWWDVRGSTEWVQYNLAKPTTATHCEVYWFDDRHEDGLCRVPQSWRLLYADAKGWHEVKAKNPFGTSPDKIIMVEFEPVTASKFRIEARLRDGFSGGILEWVVR